MAAVSIYILPAAIAANTLSRIACFVFSIAFLVPILYHNFDSEFCFRNRPGPGVGSTRSLSQMVETINSENFPLFGLGHLMYSNW